MICQEVIEQMQRSLDEDLTSAEYEAMMRHLESCPECAEMFEKLKLLSRDLEQLPKVTPPYSIVDSILPQLERIEQEHAEEAASAEPSGPLLPDNPFPKEWTELKGRPWRDRVAWRWVGGVVAAGLVVGMFVFHKPVSTQNADMSLLEAEKQQAESAAAGVNTDIRSPDPAGGQAKPDQAVNDPGTAAPSGPEPGPKKQTESPSRSSAPKPDAGQAKAATTPPKEENKKVTGESDSSKELSAASSANAAAQDGASGAADSVPTRNGQASEAGSSSNVKSGSAGGTTAAAVPKALTETSEGQTSAPAAGGQTGTSTNQGFAAQSSASSDGLPVESGSMSPKAALAAPDAAQTKTQKTDSRSTQASTFDAANPPSSVGETLNSPDGKFIAGIENQRVVIRNASTASIVYSSPFQWKEGDVVHLKEWTGHLLVYEVQLDGGSKIGVIDLDKMTESTGNK